MARLFLYIYLNGLVGRQIINDSVNYQLTPFFPAGSKILLDIDMCSDNKTLRFYEGYKDLDKVQQLQIKKLNADSNEIMIIEFPSSLSKGKEQFYRNLYAGNLIFRKGTYRIKLPNSDADCDNLPEKHFCPDYGGVDLYYDISSFQKNRCFIIGINEQLIFHL